MAYMKRSAIITTSWDDGHPLDRRVAELLAKYGLTGTFYIPLQNSRPVMSGAEIRRLSETFEIGAHTVDHVVLTEVSRETAEKQIRESKVKLEDITGKPCEAFCFPKGRFHRSHIGMVSRAGFQCARTVELLSTQFPRFRGQIYLIPTTVQATPQSWTAYIRNCATRLAPRNIVNFVEHGRKRNWSEIGWSMLEDVARHGGVFHLWGHSWEIEGRNQWSQLESVFRQMRELHATVRCVPNSKLMYSQAIGAQEVVSQPN